MTKQSTSKSFHFIAAFTGECCQRAHLWGQTVKARDLKTAVRSLRRIIEKRGGNEVFEIVVMDSPNMTFVWDCDAPNTVNDK